MALSKSARKYLAEIGRKGGLVKSKRKTEANRAKGRERQALRASAAAQEVESNGSQS